MQDRTFITQKMIHIQANITMRFLRLIIGLFLVLIPVTKGHSASYTSVKTKALQGLQVAKGEVKDNLYDEFALIEMQEKSTTVVVDHGGDSDSKTLHCGSDFFLFKNPIFFQNILSGQYGYPKPAILSRPRFILYHSLMIPF